MTARLESRTAGRQVLPGISVAALTAYLEERLADRAGLELRSVRVAGQGMSDDTILVDALDSRGSTHRSPIRRYRRDGILRALTDPQRHFRTLQALESTTVPAPLPLWYDPDGDQLAGATIGMSRLAGRGADPVVAVRSRLPAQGRRGPAGRAFRCAAG